MECKIKHVFHKKTNKLRFEFLNQTLSEAAAEMNFRKSVRVTTPIELHEFESKNFAVVKEYQ
jgi:hypothetical protein